MHTCNAYFAQQTLRKQLKRLTCVLYYSYIFRIFFILLYHQSCHAWIIFNLYWNSIRNGGTARIELVERVTLRNLQWKKLNWTDWVKQIYKKRYSQNSTIFNYNSLKLRLTLEGWKMLNSIKYELGSDFRYTFKSSSFFFSGTTSLLSAFSLSLTIYIVYIFIGSKYSSETYFHVNFRFFLQQKWQCHLYSLYLFVYSLTVKSHVHTSSSSFSCEEKYTSGNILYNSISIINTLELLWLPHIHKWSWAIRGWLQKVG